VAAAVVDAIAANADDALLEHLPGYSSGELRHLAATEDVAHLDDLLLRRTSIAFVGAATADAVAEAASAVAPVLGWDAARTALEVGRALERIHAADPSWIPAAAR
jgi:glycerol-3-phosphate dehydrogenase